MHFVSTKKREISAVDEKFQSFFSQINGFAQFSEHIQKLKAADRTLGEWFFISNEIIVRVPFFWRLRIRREFEFFKVDVGMPRIFVIFVVQIKKMCDFFVFNLNKDSFFEIVENVSKHLIRIFRKSKRKKLLVSFDCLHVTISCCNQEYIK